MIRINFCKPGTSVSDWLIDETVDFLAKISRSQSQLNYDYTYDYSNFLLLDALRAEIAEDKISLDNICFSVDDKPIEINRFGRHPSIPEQEKNLNYCTRTIIAAMKKYEEENPSLVKAYKKGQAPASDRDSTTSRDS